MNSLEFIKQHVAEWPDNLYTSVFLSNNGVTHFNSGEDFAFSKPLDLSEHFAPSYYDGKVWTREEFEAFGCGTVDWSKAPDWATCYGIGVGLTSRHVWYNDKQYTYADDNYGETFLFGEGDNRTLDDITHHASRPEPSSDTPVDDVDSTITERGNRYGKFKDGADIMQGLKEVMRATPNWSNLSPSQREALEMIQHKIGRVLNGDPNYDDNWRDIAGYSTLILEEVNGNAR